jgi:tRNA nucleotidyltransferase (CCA-adding enzyme)
MLRAVRLEQRLGFTIEPRTLELLHQAVPLLARVSGERLRDELGLTFAEAGAGAAMIRLHDLGLLAAVHPALAWDRRLSARLDELRAFQPPAEWRLREVPDAERLCYAVWLSDLDANQVAEVCARMRFSLATRAVVIDAQRLVAGLPRWPAGVSPSEVAARLDEPREESLVAAWLALADRPEARRTLQSYLARWRHVEPVADGRLLRRLGLPPGPAYRTILSTLRAAWLDGQLETAEQEHELLLALVAAQGDRG